MRLVFNQRSGVRIGLGKTLVALAAAGIITAASAELTRGNIVRDAGFELAPEISSTQFWGKWKKPTTAPVEIGVHNNENPNEGEHSLYLNGYNDPGYKLLFWGGVKERLAVPVPVSQLETFTFEVNNNYPAGILYGQYNKINFISDTGDTLGFADYVPSFPVGNWNDDPHHKFVFYKLDESWEGRWQPRELEVWKNWQNKGLPPNANITEIMIYTCGEVWNDNLYGIKSWTDNVNLAPTEFLTYDASIDSSEFRGSFLDVYVRNNGTETSEAFDVRLRAYDSSNEEVYNQTVEVGPLDSDQTELVTFDYSLNPGTYKFILTTGGLENFVLDQCSVNDWKVLENVEIGIAETPIATPCYEFNYSISTGEVRYSLPQTMLARLSVYNSAGQLEYRTGVRGEGTFRPADLKLSPGVYFTRIEAGNYSSTLKIPLIKS